MTSPLRTSSPAARPAVPPASSPGERGQVTLEYLLVGLVLIAMIGALGALWNYAVGGGFAGLLDASASHALGEAGGVADALLF